MDFAQKAYDHLAVKQLGSPGVTLGRAMHREVLQVHGAVYAFCKDGKLFVKLPLERGDALVASGDAVRFEVGMHAMKGWVGVPLPPDHDKTGWAALLAESREYVRAKIEAAG